MARRTLLILLRIVEFCSATLVLWVPFLLLLAVSAIYLFTLYQTILAPGVPIAFKYAGSDGDHTLSAMSYSIDVEHKRATVFGVSLVNEKTNRKLLTAREVRIKLDHPAFETTARDGTVNFERAKGGKFPIFGALPPSKPGATPTPFSLHATNFRATFADSSQEPTLESGTLISKLDLLSAGDQGSFRGQAKIQGGAKAEFSGSWHERGSTLFRTSFTRGEFAWAVPLVKRFLPLDAVKQMQDLASSSIMVTGNALVSVEPQQPVFIRSKLDAKAENFSWKDYVQSGSVSAEGTITETGSQVKAKVIERGRLADFDGIVAWEKGIQLAGKLNASAESRSVLAPALRKALPDDIYASKPKFSGTVNLDGDKYVVAGNLQANDVRYGSDSLRSAEMSSIFTNTGFSLKLRRGAFMGTPVDGALSMRYGKGSLKGFVQTKQRIGLDKLANRAGFAGLTGVARATAVIEGTTKNPLLNVELNGYGSYKNPDLNAMNLGQINARAQVRGGKVDLQRLSISGPSGSLLAKGSLDTKRKFADVDVFATGIQANRFSKDANGIGAVRGKLRGKFDSLAFNGEAETLGLKIQGNEIPHASAKISYQGKKFEFSDIIADNGFSHLEGSASIDFKTKQLAGSFSSEQIQIADWLQDSEEYGFVKVKNGKLFGTIENPLVAFDFSSEGASIGSYYTGPFSGSVAVDKKSITIPNLIAKMGDGSASASLKYDLDSKLFSLRAKLSDVTLSTLHPVDSKDYLTGKVSGDLSFDGTKDRTDRAEAKLSVNDLKFKQVFVGSGTINANAKNDEWEGAFALGDVQQFLIGENVKWSRGNHALQGDVSMSNAPLSQWIRPDLISQYWTLSPEIESLLSGFQGVFSTQVSVSGTSDKPRASVSDLLVDKIVINGRSGGTLSAKGTYANDQIDLAGLTWKLQESGGKQQLETFGIPTLFVKGTVKNSGDLNLEANFDDFDFTWLHTLRPDWSETHAWGSLYADIKGTATKPVVRGSSGPISFGAGITKATRDSFPQMTLEESTFTDGVFKGSGRMNYQGFVGAFEGKIPMSAFDSAHQDTDQISIHATIDDSDLADIFKNLGIGEIPKDENSLYARVVKAVKSKGTNVPPDPVKVDLTRTSGKIGGFIDLTGTADTMQLSGFLNVRNGAFAIKHVKTALTNLQISGAFKGNTLTINGSADAGKEGKITLDALATLPNFLHDGFDFDKFWDESRGNITLGINDLAFKEKLRVPGDTKDRLLAGIIRPSKLTLNGSLSAPILNGELNLSGLDAEIPTYESTETGGLSEFDPVFNNVKINLLDVAHIRTSTTDLAVRGDGSVNGSLNRPKVVANMSVEDGKFNLPNARVQLEEGGRIVFKYDAALDSLSSARLDVNLLGRTSVTAKSFADVVERYDISLAIKGNLLEDQGITILATSDPADLSQKEIMAILGQRELIESLAVGATRNQQDLLRGAIYTLAIPQITGGITRGLANALKLDYFAVEYNPFEETIFSAAKTLAKGLTLTLRRQLAEPIQGKRRYELKLAYRLPTHDKFLSRVRFGLGFDQDRPWKLTIDFVKRF